MESERVDSRPRAGQADQSSDQAVATSVPPREAGEPPQYDAFISYSRQDKEFAKGFENALERYTLPKAPNRVTRRLNIFRDEKDIAGTEYYGSVAAALRSSSKLLILCSPAARKSPFVAGEIQTFLEGGNADAIVPILVKGIPNNEAKPSQESEMAFPDVLWQAFRGGIPLAADFRGFEPAKHRFTKGPFEGAWFKALADVLGESREVVEQRERRRRARRMKIAVSVLASSIAVLASLTIWALIERSEAQRQRDLALARLLSVQSDRLAMDGGSDYERASLLAAASLGRAHIFENDLTARSRLELLPTSVSVLAHGSAVRAIAFSSDGKYVVTGTEQGTARLWDGGREQKRFEHGAPLQAVALAADGRHLLTAASDGTIRRWNVDTGEHSLAVEFTAKGWDRYLVAFSADGAWAVTAGVAEDVGADIRVWDLHGTTAQRRIRFPRLASSLALNRNGTRLAIGTWTGSVHLVTVAGQEETAREFAGRIEAVSFSPNGREVVVSGSDRHVWIWDTRSTNATSVDIRNPSGASTVALHGEEVLIGGPGPPALWAARNAEQLVRITHAASVSAVAISPDGRLLATASDDGTARVTRAEAGKYDARRPCANRRPSVPLAGAGRRIGAALAVVGACLAVVRQETSPPLASLIRDAAGGVLSANDELLITVPWSKGALRSVENSGRVVVTEVRTGRVVADIGTGATISAIAVSGDGRRVATAGRVLNLIDLEDGRSRVLLRDVPRDALRSVALNGDGSRLAVGMVDEVRVIDAADGAQLVSVKQSGRIRVVRYSPDEQTFLTAGDDGTVYIRDTKTGAERRSLKVGGVIMDAAWSEDGLFMATASVDRLAQVWSAEDGREVIRISHRGPVHGVAFAEEGRVLATTSGDPTSNGDFIELHHLAPTAMVRQLCRRIRLTLSSDEWRNYVGSVGFQPPCGTVRP
jgi:WD40 repeat protein